jgi:MFS family permease
MPAMLRRRNFALVWWAGLVSMLGDRALLTALPYYVYEQTSSTLATAAMFTTYYLPMVLLGSVAGVFVDHWDRRRIMVSANLIQTVVILLLLLVRFREWAWLVYAVSFVEISVATFFQPAESALLPSLVDEGDLVSANALTSVNANIARLAGPAVGGVLMGVFGLGSIVLFDSASFLIAAALTSMLSLPGARIRGTVDSAAIMASAWARLWRDWRDGLRLVMQSGRILWLFVVASTTSFGGAMFDPLIAPWVRAVLHAGAATLGWLLSAGALGGLLGGIILTRFGRDRSPTHLNAFGNMLAGSLLLLTYNLAALPMVLILSVLAGVPLVGSGAGLQTLLQTGVPDRYRGRVFGALNTTIALVGLAGLWLAGTLGQTVGIVPMLSAAAGITIVAGILALAVLPKRTLSEMPLPLQATGGDALNEAPLRDQEEHRGRDREQRRRGHQRTP